MYNNYFLVKKIEDEQGNVAFATASDSFAFKGEIVRTPAIIQNDAPEIGDHVLFVKHSGEDVEIDGEPRKVIKFEDIIMKIK